MTNGLVKVCKAVPANIIGIYASLNVEITPVFHYRFDCNVFHQEVEYFSHLEVCLLPPKANLKDAISDQSLLFSKHRLLLYLL